MERYQGQMRDLKALLRDPSATEFVAVAAPTALAVDETKRLVGTLNDEGIPVKHLVVNRVIDVIFIVDMVLLRHATKTQAHSTAMRLDQSGALDE